MLHLAVVIGPFHLTHLQLDAWWHQNLCNMSNFGGTDKLRFCRSAAVQQFLRLPSEVKTISLLYASDCNRQQPELWLLERNNSRATLSVTTILILFTFTSTSVVLNFTVDEHRQVLSGSYQTPVF
jgi:hypothetical protein